MFVRQISAQSLLTVGILTALLTAGPAVAQEVPDPDAPHQVPVPASASRCPSFDSPCGLDLVTGTVSPGCDQQPYFTVHSAPEDSDDDGWLEPVVGVDLTDECSRVCVVLDYTEVPTGFTLNLGDSSTNDGFAGGAVGSLESESEVQIYHQRLTLWSFGIASGIADRVAEADLQLENGSYKVCVSDQRVTFGQPQSIASTPNSKLLFKLPDSGTSPPNSEVFIGLNRVVRTLGGPPVAGRTGSGLRRAYITVE